MIQKTQFSKKNTLALKGIAIIMMMFHHCFRGEHLFKNYKVSFFPFMQNFVVDISLTFKICVSIFAFITGYGLILSLKKLDENYNWSKKQICKWTIGRLIKTLSGFWIIAILAFIICQIIDERTTTLFFKDGIAYGIIQMVINFAGLAHISGIANFCSTWWYMSLAVLFVISVPIWAKLLKNHSYIWILSAIVAVPRIIGWKYVDNSYISFLFPLLLGIIFAEKNLMVKIANAKVVKNEYINKIIKLIIETIVIIGLYLIYTKLPIKLFYELKYGVIPVCLICYLYEFFIDLPIIRHVLMFLGKHSMNIFLIHTFYRGYYLKDFIYSHGNFIKIAFVLLSISLVTSIVLELFKKLIRYDKIMSKLQILIEKKIDTKYQIEN